MNTGLRTSTNSALAGGLSVLSIWAISTFYPEALATAPVGLEAGLTAVFMWIIARLSVTPANPGAL